MHFSSAITALLALPALSYAVAIPQKRQNVDCQQFNLLSVGELIVSNEDTRGSLALVQVRNTQGNQVNWEGIADVAPGTSQMIVNHISRGSGYKNLRVCKSGGDCYYPGVPKQDIQNKVWNMMTSGDRWLFALTVRDGSDERQIQALCGVGGKIVDGATTTTPIVTTTTTTQAAPTTTTTTSAKPTTTTTSVKSTTTSSGRTSTTSSAKNTTTTTARPTTTTTTRATTTTTTKKNRN